MPGPPDHTAASPIGLNDTVEETQRAADHHRSAAEVERITIEQATARMNSHRAAEAGYRRELAAMEDRIHAELKAWADLVNPPLSNDRNHQVEVDMMAIRSLDRSQYDNPAVHPADNPDEPTPCNPDAHPEPAVVPPPPPPPPAMPRKPPPPPPPVEKMPPVATGAQQVDLFPDRRVEPIFDLCEPPQYYNPDSYVIAAQHVACLLARHNEVGFERLREDLESKSPAFAKLKTEGNGETWLPFQALSLLLLIRVGV